MNYLVHFEVDAEHLAHQISSLAPRRRARRRWEIKASAGGSPTVNRSKHPQSSRYLLSRSRSLGDRQVLQVSYQLQQVSISRDFVRDSWLPPNDFECLPLWRCAILILWVSTRLSCLHSTGLYNGGNSARRSRNRRGQWLTFTRWFEKRDIRGRTRRFPRILSPLPRQYRAYRNKTQ